MKSCGMSASPQAGVKGHLDLRTICQEYRLHGMLRRSLNNKTSKLAHAAMLLACVQEIFYSDLGRDTDYPD
jgi:hypothetical protein